VPAIPRGDGRAFPADGSVETGRSCEQNEKDG
jgi:hypothetical protein